MDALIQALGPFGLGVVATLSPCALPLYPGFLAYLAAGSGRGRAGRWLGFMVLAGVLTTMLTAGALIAGLTLAAGRVIAVVTPLADLLVILLGAMLVLGFNPFVRIPVLAPRAGRGTLTSAYVYGLLYGPMTLPCMGPLVLSVFSLSVGVASFAGKLVYFLAFGVGFGLPLLLISLLAQARQAVLVRWFARHEYWVIRVAGLVLVGVGAADLWINLPVLRLNLGI